MTINEYEFFNGVVLNGILKSGKELKISEFPTSSKNSFTINGNKIGIYIKYSKKIISPWRFTFLKEHQDEFKEMAKLCDHAFLILVCKNDGIASIESNVLKKVLDENHEPTEWISASRLKRESYTIKGTDGKLNYKINLKDFPRDILNCL